MCIAISGCNQSVSEPTVAGRWYTQSQIGIGKQLYLQHCVVCHLEDARGTDNWKQTTSDGKYPPPPLNGTAHAWHHPLSVLKKVIAEGGIPLGGKMPGFADKLDEQQSLAVISYFQSFWTDEIYAAWIARGGLK
jgi:mono/diheme cytochrome c family protein